MEKEIERVMRQDFPLPEKVEKASNAAFAQIQRRQEESAAEKATGKINGKVVRKVTRETGSKVLRYENKMAHRKWGVAERIAKIGTGVAAAAALFSGVCITNPTFAAKIPLVGHVFEQIGDSIGFGGDFTKYATPLEDTDSQNAEVFDEEEAEKFERETPKDSLYTKTVNGVTLTLSEVYANDEAMYLSMIIQSEEKLPATATMQNGAPVIELSYDTQMKFDYEDETHELGNADLDGKMLDEHTFVGVLRYDLRKMSVTGEEIAATVPDHFGATLTIPRIVGLKEIDETPKMPEELIAQYEQEMRENGLDPSDEAFASFTEEQIQLDTKLRNKQYNEYLKLYPEAGEYPNKYANWWFDGSWEYTFEVDKDNSQTIVKEFNDVDENGLGLVSVTKTPFEIVVEDGMGYDYFTAVLDADGIPLDNGTFGGNANTLAISGRDTSKIQVFICDYIEYMDELKGYYWSEDYEEKAKEKTYAEYLSEHALYQKEISFE